MFEWMVAAMADLTSPLDGLAAQDLHALSEPQLLDRVRELVAAQNRLAAELARTVRAAETAQACAHDGLRSMASWLRGHARLSGSAAGQLVRTGRALEQLPALAEAAAAGLVTGEQVAVISQVVRLENLSRAQAQGVDLAAIGALLTQVATTRPHTDLVRAVAHYLARLDPDGPEPDPTAHRSLTLTRHADGSLSGRLELDAVGGEKLQAAIESIAQANRPAGDQRSRAQRLADAMVQLMDNQLAYGHLPQTRTVKPQLGILIDHQDLFDPATGPTAATAGFGATLSAARTRWAACDAQVTRIVLDPDGLPLDVGRRPRCRGPRRACEAWGAAGSFHSPAAMPRPGGATPTTRSNGHWAGKRRWRTPPSCANTTTPRSTTATASNEHPTAGTPTDPTAPKSSSHRRWRQPEEPPAARDVSGRARPAARRGGRAP